MRLHGIIDDASAYISSLVHSAVDWVGDKASSGIRDFRAKLLSFQQRYEYLKKNPPPMVVSTDVMSQYNALLADAKGIASKAATVESAIKAIERTLGVTLGGYGFLPAAVIPAATVAGILGVVYLINQFMARSDAFIRDKMGLPPATADKGIIESASSIVWPLAIVAGAVFLLNKGSRT